MDSSSDAGRNRAYWDRTAAEYQERHGAFIGQAEPRWGIWQIPDSELQVLGDVGVKDVLELGCGAAQWSILLAKRGARPVGLDNSSAQLEHARRLMAEAGVDFPLVHACAEDVPLPDESFDIVFCDHGALTFADPYRLMPECVRLLRQGGLLAFSHMSPFAQAALHPETEMIEPVLHRDYFGLHRLGEGDPVEFNLPYGEWIGLFRQHGFAIEALIEPRPAPDATSTYWEESERDWARRWPSEAIWKARKQ
ncbi:MAG: class I SAM-dependent methyltransferase [Actinomycetota bacterium]|nr:class I SAM-dependent methyltransferase [Actinomycetota bacterium]